MQATTYQRPQHLSIREHLEPPRSSFALSPAPPDDGPNADLNVPAEPFQEAFKEGWRNVLENRRAFNAKDAMTHLGVSEEGLDTIWQAADAAGHVFQLYPRCWCAKILNREVIDDSRARASISETARHIFVFNGFYMKIRKQHLEQTAKGLMYFLVQWDPVALSLPYADFAANIIGADDPAEAASDSLRGVIHRKWRWLEMPAGPTLHQNGIHYSSSPLESLYEVMNWLGVEPKKDPFGTAIWASVFRLFLPSSWGSTKHAWGVPSMHEEYQACMVAALPRDVRPYTCASLLVCIGC